MANQWTWETVTEGLTGEWREFIRLCNRRLKDLQVKVASLVSYPVGGGTANNIPRWDSTGTGLADSALSDNGTILASTEPLALGATPATSGILRLPNNQQVNIRNGANTNDIVLLVMNGSDVLQFWTWSLEGGVFRPLTDDIQDFGSTSKRIQTIYLSKDIGSASFPARVAYLSTGVALGTTPATTGLVRLPNAQGILFRDQANAADMTMIASNTSDEVVVRGTWKASSNDSWAPTSNGAQDLGTSSLMLRDAYISREIEGLPGGCPHSIDGWYQDNVAASQTNVELTRATGRWAAVRAGSVIGVLVISSEARTAGTLTVTVYKNTGLAGAAGSSIGLTAVLDGTNTSRKATTQAKDTDAFAVGDELYPVVTTDGSWLPVTADIRVVLLVEC